MNIENTVGSLEGWGGIGGRSAARAFGQWSKYAPRVNFDAEKGSGESDETGGKKEELVVEKESEKEILSDKEAALLKEVMEKKSKLKAAEESVAETAKRLADANNRLKDFDGIDPVEIRKMLEERKTAEKAALEAKGDFERVKTMMAEEHKKEVEAILSEAKSKSAELARALAVINDLTIGAAFNESSFVSEDLTLTATKARIIYGSHFDVEDGRVVAYDKPRGSEDRTKLVNGNGESIGFEDAIKKLVDADPDKDRLIRSKLKIGGDSKTIDAKIKEKIPDVRGRDRIAIALEQASKK